MAAQDDPTLREAVEAQLNERMFGTRTAMLCRVISYKDTPRPLVTVQVAANKWRREGGKIVTTPELELSDVPVMELAWGPFVVRGQLERGDHGVLLVCDRNIDPWITEGGGDENGSYDPGLALIHDINDALFLPAIQPNKFVSGASPKVGTRQLVIGDRSGTTSIKFDAGTPPKIDITSSAEVNVNAANVNLGNENPAQGAHSIARVGVDYVVCSTPGTPVPILPGTALPVPGVPPGPAPLPSAHKVRG